MKIVFLQRDSFVKLAVEYLSAVLKADGHQCDLFIESGEGYQGKRLFLTKISEEENDELVGNICRRCDYTMHRDSMTRYVVSFTIGKVLPLVGSSE